MNAILLSEDEVSTYFCFGWFLEILGDIESDILDSGFGI